jgi:hypothetical protein
MTIQETIATLKAELQATGEIGHASTSLVEELVAYVEAQSSAKVPTKASVAPKAESSPVN